MTELRSIAGDESISTPAEDLILRRLSLALGNPPSTALTHADAYFGLIRQLLMHVLDGDLTFTVDELYRLDGAQDERLRKLYQSDKTRALVAQVRQVSAQRLTAAIIHRFFADLVRLNGEGLETPDGREQLDDYLYNPIVPFWSPDIVLGQGDFASLGTLLKDVPQDLRFWLLQFRRGKDLMPLAQWLKVAPDALLYRAMARAEKSPEQASPLHVVCKVLHRILPDDERLQDDVVMASLDAHLAGLPVWLTIIDYLGELPKAQRLCGGLDVDLTTPVSQTARHEFFGRVVRHALNPDAQPWLNAAIKEARNAHGLRGLTLAVVLHARQQTLVLEEAMHLASLLLTTYLPLDAQSSVDFDALPMATQLVPSAPELAGWSGTQDVDQLLDALGFSLLCHGVGQKRTLRMSAHQTWLTLAQTHQFQQWIRPMLRQLGWYGGEPGQWSSQRINQALAGQALVDFFLGARAEDPALADGLVKASVCEFTHVQIVEKLRADIATRLKQKTPALVDLMFYLLVRDSAAEFLIVNVPDFIVYGRSLQSVALIHGVQMIEASSRYASIGVDFDALAGLAADTSRSDDRSIRSLREVTLVRPALLYAAAHQRINPADADLRKCSAQEVQQALNHLKEQQEDHSSDIARLLAVVPPDRGKMADHFLAAQQVPAWLTKQGIKPEHWDIHARYGLTLADSYNRDRIAGRLTGNREATFRELVMMGEIYRAGEPDINSAYDDAFKRFREDLVSAHVPVIKRLLTQMPAQDLRALSNATVEISRVSFKGQEGDFGVFLRCRQGRHVSNFEHADTAAEFFYEIIPASGVARRVAQRFGYRAEEDHGLRANLAGTVVREEENRERRLAARNTPLHDLDSDAYLMGTASRFSERMHEPARGLLVPAGTLLYMPDVTQVDLDALALAAANHLHGHRFPIQALEQRHVTPWEQTWEKEKQVLDTALRLIVPFYGCVKDLSESRHSAGVLIGCAMDVIFTLIPLGQFATTTARITRIAGELTVRAIAQEMTAAVKNLLVGLIKQSGAVAAFDLLEHGISVARVGLRALMKLTPRLAEALKSDVQKEIGFAFDAGVYRAAKGADESATGTRLASVDGRGDVPIVEINSSGISEYRLMDPYSQRPFGPRLFGDTASAALQLSRVDTLVNEARVVPVHEVEDGFFQFRHDPAADPLVIERESGVYDVLWADDVYRLSTDQRPTLLKHLSLEGLPSDGQMFEPEEIVCRVARMLDPVPCEGGLKLIKHPPAVTNQDDAGLLGRYASAAMQAREFKLMRRIRPAQDGLAERSIDVWVHEGKLCTPVPGVGGSTARALSDEEILEYSLPGTITYRQSVAGALSGYRWRQVEGVTDVEAAVIHDQLPAVELGSIAEDVADTRSLRGLVLSGQPKHIVVEADAGVFYKTTLPADGSIELEFERLDAGRDAEMLDQYLFKSEQYRLVSERPGALHDRENIARMLFDLRDKAPWWDVRRIGQVSTYEAYVAACARLHQPNELLECAGNILSHEAMQRDFVALAKQSIPDYQTLGVSSAAVRRDAAQVLNRLLPVQGREIGWQALNAESFTQAETAERIQAHINHANLAYAKVETRDGQQLVYYALSGGKRSRRLRLKADLQDKPDQVFDGVPYIDARQRMQGVTPDPWFTSLPVVRSNSAITIYRFDRHLDSERLLASVMRRDLAAIKLKSIQVFTLLDTCRSCGGFVLPRLKLDFPDASFSVRYLKRSDIA